MITSKYMNKVRTFSFVLVWTTTSLFLPPPIWFCTLPLIFPSNFVPPLSLYPSPSLSSHFLFSSSSPSSTLFTQPLLPHGGKPDIGTDWWFFPSENCHHQSAIFSLLRECLDEDVPLTKRPTSRFYPHHAQNTMRSNRNYQEIWCRVKGKYQSHSWSSNENCLIKFNFKDNSSIIKLRTQISQFIRKNQISIITKKNQFLDHLIVVPSFWT